MVNRANVALFRILTKQRVATAGSTERPIQPVRGERSLAGSFDLLRRAAAARIVDRVVTRASRIRYFSLRRSSTASAMKSIRPPTLSSIDLTVSPFATASWPHRLARRPAMGARGQGRKPCPRSDHFCQLVDGMGRPLRGALGLAPAAAFLTYQCLDDELEFDRHHVGRTESSARRTADGVDGTPIQPGLLWSPSTGVGKSPSRVY